MDNAKGLRRGKFGIVFKFTITISALIILMSISFGYFISRRQIDSIMGEFESRANTLIRTLAYSSEFGVLAENRELLHKILKGVQDEKDVYFADIYDKEGNLIAHTDWHREEEDMSTKQKYELEGIVFNRLFSETIVSDKPVVYKGKLLEGKVPIYNVTLPVKTVRIPEEPEALLGIPGAAEEKEEVIGVARIGLSLVGVEKLISDTISNTLFITIALMLAGIIITILLVRIILRPIKQLLLGTDKVAEGDLSYKVTVTTSDEIGELAVSFNRMTKNLENAKRLVDERTKELESTNTSLLKANYELEKTTKELKEAQAQLVQSSKMTAIGQLGAGVAHELNNPIGGILGYAQYMLSKINRPEFSSEDFKTCKKYLGHIERESGRCKSIVENLLTFSRKSDIVEAVDISKVIDSTLTIIGHQMQLKNIKIEKDIDAELAKVNANANKLQQVFTNMMLNSQHAMPDGGTLSLSAHNIKEGAAPKVQIEIEDTGCGIEKEHLERIFEPFFTTKQDWKGTGLGLAITYQIIEEMKGKIKVESEVGKGTKFTITLPAMV